MKKILAAISTLLLVGAFAFADGYISANDAEEGAINSVVAFEDGFFVNGNEKKAVTVQKDGQGVVVDGEAYTQRFSMGAMLKPENGGSHTWPSISFTAKKGQVVTLIGLSSSKSDARVVVMYNEAGEVVAEFPVIPSSQVADLKPTKQKVPADGTYYLGSKNSTIYIYQVTVGKK